MTTNELRELYLKFFEAKGHLIIDSAPLIPINDPSLLWINAGITPLKTYFDGSSIPPSKRLTSAQKCLRTNDIENVGLTARHHTCFEMLGNFSIGDYFKEEAIEYGFEFLTSPNYLNFDLDKLYFTYYPSDIETRDKWISLGVDPKHLYALEGNFWEIGEGPCGPCSEIFYDRGVEFGDISPDILIDDIENDRYVEIWNIVFSSYNASVDLNRQDYPELPQKNIDTGMGLERVSSIVQNAKTNFETDGFLDIIKETEKICGVEYTGQMAFKVIADHVRTVTYCLSDGALLSNEGRGYVLRRLLRRAMKHGRDLGLKEAFLYKLVDIVAIKAEYYPEVLKNKEYIKKIVKQEEDKFLHTLDKGEKILLDLISTNKQLSGHDAFIMYDTYGFPFELTKEIAAEYNCEISETEFLAELEVQKNRSRSSREDMTAMSSQNEELLAFDTNSEFIGYECVEAKVDIIAIIQDGKIVDKAKGNCYVVLNKTPFYAESGGQVSDSGYIEINNIQYNVVSVAKLPHGQHAHELNVDVEIGLGTVNAVVNATKRFEITKNHSATHLLHYAIKTIIGEHATQKGSYVNESYMRFDFNHYESVTNEMLFAIEDLVNQQIQSLIGVQTEVLAIEDAKKLGANALFGEKYGDVVRVILMGESKEFCGGCHVKNTSDIKAFSIISIESKGSGVFRITGTTDELIYHALKESVEDKYNEFTKITELISTMDCDLELYNEIVEDIKNIDTEFYSYKAKQAFLDALQRLQKKFNNLLMEIKKLETANALQSIDLNTLVQEINGLRVVVARFDLDQASLKTLVDNSLNEGIDFIYAISQLNKLFLVCSTNQLGLDKNINCGSLIKETAPIVGGRGGGKNNFAQAGGEDDTKVEQLTSYVLNYLNNL